MASFEKLKQTLSEALPSKPARRTQILITFGFIIFPLIGMAYLFYAYVLNGEGYTSERKAIYHHPRQQESTHEETKGNKPLQN